MKPKIYLAGAIQKSADPFTWRLDFKKALENEYDVIVPGDKLDLPPNPSLAQKQKAIKYGIIIKDICDVISCQELFVKIDPAVFKGAGTLSEITFGCIYNKPMVCWFEDMGIKDTPGWVQGCLYGATMVDTLPQAIDHFKVKIDHYLKT